MALVIGRGASFALAVKIEFATGPSKTVEGTQQMSGRFDTVGGTFSQSITCMSPPSPKSVLGTVSAYEAFGAQLVLRGTVETTIVVDGKESDRSVSYEDMIFVKQ
jgi:hypothetical protein